MLCYYPLESELGPKVHGAPNFLCPPCSAAYGGSRGEMSEEKKSGVSRPVLCGLRAAR